MRKGLRDRRPRDAPAARDLCGHCLAERKCFVQCLGRVVVASLPSRKLTEHSPGSWRSVIPSLRNSAVANSNGVRSVTGISPGQAARSKSWLLA
jgi:hypothetical protein